MNPRDLTNEELDKLIQEKVIKDHWHIEVSRREIHTTTLVQCSCEKEYSLPYKLEHFRDPIAGFRDHINPS